MYKLPPWQYYLVQSGQSGQLSIISLLHNILATLIKFSALFVKYVWDLFLGDAFFLELLQVKQHTNECT